MIEMNSESVKKIFDSVGEILIKKNSDYGSASFDLGTVGNMVHLWDKVRRYRSLIEKMNNGEKPNFESIQDTLKDIIGYAVIGLHIIGESTDKEEKFSHGVEFDGFKNILREK